MNITRISRRNVLKAGAGLAGALALPTIVTSRGMAAGGTQPLNMQLGLAPGGNQIGEVVAKRLGYLRGRGHRLRASRPAGRASTASRWSLPAATRSGRCRRARR